MISVEQVKNVTPDLINAVRLLLPQLTKFNPILNDEDIQEMIQSQASSLWIAKNESGEIIGMLSLAIYRTTTGIHAWIEDVVVDQKARRQGVGGRLTLAAVEFAHQNNAKAVSLTSRPEREAANQLYQKLGFEFVKTNLYRKNLI
ncbi:MAG: GNAT family N-acetyltransferase [Anaerolineaceae bacterium]|nr:GNAT family N-acetyltransferase [Anaerolineaceae bacterium]